MPGPTKRRFRNRVNVPANLYSPFQYTSPGTTISYSGVYPYTVNPLQYANNPVPSVNLAPLQQVNLSKMYGGRPVPTVNYSWTPQPTATPVTQTPAPQQPRPPTPVTQTPAPPYAYTPPPAWISSLYPNTAPQAAEPTPTATPQAPTYAPQQSKDWYKNLFLYRKDGTPTAYSGGPVDYGMSWENVDRYLETGDPGALNRFGQPVGTPAPLSYSGFSGRARGGQPRKRTPELEAKLQWAHQTLNDLRRGKKPQKQQSSGRTAPAWVGGIGSFNV